MKGKVPTWVALIVLMVGGGAALSEDSRRANEVTHKEQKETGKTKEALRRDLARDRKTEAKSIPRDRTVFRYTTKDQAKTELHKGISKDSHMTASGGPGRPLSGGKAQQKYGLPQKPEVRETVRLKKGQQLRSNRVVGGAPGLGELTPSKRVPSKAIEKVVPLQ